MNLGGAGTPQIPPGSPVTPQMSQSEPHASSSETSATNNQQSPDFSLGVPLRYRTLNDLMDSTQEIHDFEYNGLCMLATDEPVSVEIALVDQN